MNQTDVFNTLSANSSFDIYYQPKQKPAANKTNEFSQQYLSDGQKAIHPVHKKPFRRFAKLATQSALPYFKQKVSKKAIEEEIPWINSKKEDSIILDELKTKLNSYGTAQSNLGLQSELLSVAARIPSELSQLLIADEGTVNVGFVNYLLDKLFVNQNNFFPYLKHIHWVLQQLANNPKLIEKIERLEKPLSSDDLANDLIRVTLGLPLHHQVTDNDAKKTALSALLSYLRQGRIASCFATNLAIQLLSSDLSRCLDDFAELIKYSKLTRIVDGHPQDFPFILRMGIDRLDKVFTIDHQGKVMEGFISDSPGLQAACAAIGIENSTEVIVKVASRLLEGKDSVKIRVDEFLKNLALFVSQKKFEIKKSADALYQLACLAFDAQLQSPLLHSWVNAIAGMAECTKKGLVKGDLIDAVTKAFEKKTDSFQYAERKEFKKVLIQFLDQRIQYKYDPNPSHEKIWKNGKSTGAFILYNAYWKNLNLTIKQVENLSDFRALILSVLRQVEILLSQNSKTPEEVQQWNQKIKGLRRYVDTNKFIVNCLGLYDCSNRKIKDPIKVINRLKHTPWKDQCGNNSDMIHNIYFERSFTLSKSSISNAFHLLCKLIHWGRNASSSTKEELKTNPLKLYWMRTLGVHAFSFIPGHSFLGKSFISKLPAATWVEKEILVPGREIANSTVSILDRNAVIDYLCKDFIPKSAVDQFRNFADSLPYTYSYSRFRNGLLYIIRRMSLDLNSKFKEIEIKLDEYLCNHALSPSALAQLKKTVINFADTNWSNGLDNIYFCLIVNPGNGQLEIWKTYGTILKPLNQAEWVKGKSWEIET